MWGMSDVASLLSPRATHGVHAMSGSDELTDAQL